MRVCIPSFSPGGLDAPVSEHFGHCEVFTVADIEDDKIVAAWPLSNEQEGGHNCAIPVQRIIDEGVDCMIVGGIGRGPLMGFNQLKIDVYSGATGTIEDTLNEFIKGLLSLVKIDHVCKGGCH
ncbi:MAG: NifB/NifX family molybdenum-iron cluster-binding protein [Methanosarcinaceae archaeon]|nr:NifB/NifX family molybdenum-iron cluster-binding protein [Methanosarcinaceae archaeon]